MTTAQGRQSVLLTAAGLPVTPETRVEYLARINASTIGELYAKHGGPGCPRCGATQFKVRRRMSTKFAFGALSLLGQAKHVRCVRCNLELDR